MSSAWGVVYRKILKENCLNLKKCSLTIYVIRKDVNLTW